MSFIGYTRLGVICLALAASACSTLPRNALPGNLVTQATIPGMPVIRAYGGENPDRSAR